MNRKNPPEMWGMAEWDFLHRAVITMVVAAVAGGVLGALLYWLVADRPGGGASFGATVGLALGAFWALRPMALLRMSRPRPPAE